MTEDRDHTAAASLDGSLSQFDYALLVLARGGSTRVGIETLDDVAQMSVDGSVIQTQRKQSLAPSGYAITLLTGHSAITLTISGALARLCGTETAHWEWPMPVSDMLCPLPTFDCGILPFRDSNQLRQNNPAPSSDHGFRMSAGDQNDLLRL